MDRALVTGGSGFFGTLLIQELLARGDAVSSFDIVAPDKLPSPVVFRQGDIRDEDAVREVCQTADVIYHCVAQIPVAKDRDLFFSVNVGGVEKMLRAALAAGVRKVILVSSSAIFGIPRQLPVDENSPTEPREDYGRAKLGGEQAARRFHAETGLDVTLIRPSTIIGHGRLGLFMMLFEWVRQGRSVYVLGKGDNRFSFVHAVDLADACIRAAQRPGFRVYNVGSANVCPMRDTLQALIAHAGTAGRVRSLPKAPAQWSMNVLSSLGLAPFAPFHWLMYGRSLYFDITRARTELAWEPSWQNAEMICQAYDWYLEHREEIGKQPVRASHASPVREGALRVLRWFS